MSRYFARLAQRSGFIPPRVAGISGNRETAQLVEQNTYVESTAPNTVTPPISNRPASVTEHATHPTPATPSRQSPEAHPHESGSQPSASPFVEITTSLAPAILAPAMDVPLRTTDTARIPASPVATTDKKTGIPESHDIVSSPKRTTVSSPETGDHESARLSRTDITPDAAFDRPVKSGLSADEAPFGELAPAISVYMDTRPESRNRPQPTRMAEQSDRAESSATEVMSRQQETSPAPRRRERIITHTTESKRGEVASPKKESSRQASAQDVEVRIGAVRLEVYAPSPTPAAPVSGPSHNEPRRVALRRHYLRG